jgi:5-methylcytosine-specific restriction endonuclease McrA
MPPLAPTPLRGEGKIVEVDETEIGGKAKNRVYCQTRGDELKAKPPLLSLGGGAFTAGTLSFFRLGFQAPFQHPQYGPSRRAVVSSLLCSSRSSGFMSCIMEFENLEGKKEHVKGGGVCIYCGCDGKENKLTSEHTVPYSLGGSTELLEASCEACGGITSYLDGYLAGAVFHHLRVHMGLQSRSGHPEVLPEQ